MQATATVMAHVGDRQWWRKTLKSIKGVESSDVSAQGDSNKSFAKVGKHPFYCDALSRGDVFESRVSRRDEFAAETT